MRKESTGMAGRWGRVFAAVLSAMALTGCFEFSEEIWIREDMTGRIRMEFGLSSALVALGGEMDEDPLAELRASYEATKQELETNPNVAAVKIEEYNEEGLHWLTMDVDIKDVRLLEGEVTDTLNRQGMFGSAGNGQTGAPGWSMNFRSTGRRRVEFTQIITVNEDKPATLAPPPVGPDGEPFAQFGDAMGRAMVASMFGDRYVTVTLHAPNITTANGNLNDEHTTVQWKIPLVDLLTDEPIHRQLRAEYELPLQWASLPMAGAVAAIVVLVVAIRWRLRAGTVPPPGPAVG